LGNSTKADVGVGHAFGIHLEESAEKGVHREVTPFDSVIEAAQQGEVLPKRSERFEEARHLVSLARSLREKLGLVEAEEVANGDQSLGSCGVGFGGAQGRAGPEDRKGFQGRKGEGNARSLEKVAARRSGTKRSHGEAEVQERIMPTRPVTNREVTASPAIEGEKFSAIPQGIASTLEGAALPRESEAMNLSLARGRNSPHLSLMTIPRPALNRALFLSLALGLSMMSLGRAEKAAGKFTLSKTKVGYELKTPDGRTVFGYMTVKPEGSKLTANSTCCFYPVFTPRGTRVVDFAPDDHLHHRGIFLAWHNIQGKPGGDFWGWGKFAPTEGRVIRNKRVSLLSTTEKGASLLISNAWMADEVVMMDEQLVVHVREVKGAYQMDLLYQLTPKNDLTLGRTAFSGFNVKSRKGKSSYSDPDGIVERPGPHHLKPETDWPSKPWYDYSFELEDGTKAGVTVIDHKKNPGTMWHNLKPIAMLNPCIVAPAEVKLGANKPLNLHYRLVLHDGAVPKGVVARAAKKFARE
jgi:hypothetical protein